MKFATKDSDLVRSSVIVTLFATLALVASGCCFPSSSGDSESSSSGSSATASASSEKSGDEKEEKTEQKMTRKKLPKAGLSAELPPKAEIKEGMPADSNQISLGLGKTLLVRKHASKKGDKAEEVQKLKKKGIMDSQKLVSDNLEKVDNGFLYTMVVETKGMGKEHRVHAQYTFDGHAYQCVASDFDKKMYEKMLSICKSLKKS
mgnify:CR=1 FL=1